MRGNAFGMSVLLFHHGARRLWVEWGRAALLLTAVGLGISVFVAVLYASDASVRSFRDSISSLGGEDSIELRSRAGGLTPGDRAVLYPALRNRFELVSFWEGRGSALGRKIDIVAFEPSEAASRLNWPTRGAESGDEDVWWGSAPLRDKLGLPSAAPSLTVALSGREITLPFRLLPESVEKRLGSNALYTTLGAVSELRGAGLVTGIRLYPRDETAPNTVTALAQFLEAGRDRRLFLANPRERAAQAERLFAAFQLNIGVLVLMTLLVCAFVVFGAAQLSVVTLQRELGIMRTIGFSRPLLGAVVLAEALLVGVLGTVLGLTVGRPITEWCAGLFLKSVSVLYAGGERPENLWGRSLGEVIALSLIVGIGLSLLGAIAPAIRATKVPPGMVARMKGFVLTTPSGLLRRFTFLAVCCASLLAVVASSMGLAWAAHASSFCVIALVVSGAWWLLDVLAARLRHLFARFAGVPGLLAAANVISGSRVVGVAVAASGVGLSLLIGLGVMVSSFRYTLIDWIDYTIRGDLFLRALEVGGRDRPARLPPEFEGIVANIDGIQEVVRFASFEFETEMSQITVGGQDFSSHPKARSFNYLSGTPSAEELSRSDSVVVSESASKKLGLTVGDALTVSGVSARVIGVFKDYSSEHGIVLFELARFRRLFGDVPLTSAVIIVAEGKESGAIAEAIHDSTIGEKVSIQRNHELREAILSIFDQTFQITELMRFIVALICVLGFILTALQLHEERRFEIRTLLTLGLSRRGLQGSVFLEGLLMLTPGLLVGALGGTLLALILIHLVNPLSFGWTLNFVPTLRQYGMPILIVFCSNFIAAALVSVRAGTLTRRRENDDETE